MENSIKKFHISSEGMRIDFVFDNNHLGIQFSSERGDPGSMSICIPNVSVSDFINSLDGFRDSKEFVYDTDEFILEIEETSDRFGDYPTLEWSVNGKSTPSTMVEGWIVCSTDEFLTAVSQLIG